MFTNCHVTVIHQSIFIAKWNVAITEKPYQEVVVVGGQLEGTK